MENKESIWGKRWQGVVAWYKQYQKNKIKAPLVINSEAKDAGMEPKPAEVIQPTPKETTRENTDNGFLSFPIDAKDSEGNSINHRTAKISAVIDHYGTAIDPENKSAGWGKRAKDNRVRAFNGEVGDYTKTTSGPYGFTKKDLTPFFQNKEINYIGVYDSSDQHKPTYYLNYDGHSGYDYPYPQGTPLLAPADGLLHKAIQDSINGTRGWPTAWEGWHTFYINHQNGFSTWFLHCTKLHDDIEDKILEDFTKSYEVKRGRVVGYIGGWGRVGIHLHFEVRSKDGAIIDPYADKLWRESAI